MDARALLFMEVQTPDGETEGPVDVHLIRERIYAGRYRGQEQVRTLEGSWRAIISFPELAEVLTLVGVDVEAMQIRERQQMTGWKAKPAPVATPSAPELPVAVPEAPVPEKESKLPVPALVAFGAAVVALVLALVFLT